MATALAIQPLAPRPSPRTIAPWSLPKKQFMEGKENRPALKQLQQSAPAARSRRERPCDGCRRRKSKCVLQDSRRCVLCEFHKQECTFVENAQPRKRKVEEISTTPTLDRAHPRTSPVTTESSSTAVSSPRQRIVPATTNGNASANVPYASASLQTPRNPFAVDESLSLQRHHHCKYLGQTTALDAALVGLGSFTEKNETQSHVGTLRRVTGSEYFSIHTDAEVPIPDDEARALAEIDAVVGQYGPALIELYFRHVHPNYPIIQKTTFMDRHQHGDRQFNPPLLASMYLLALNWWSSSPELSPHPRPDASRLEYIAITSLNIAMQRPKISALQAGLLLLQRPRSSTWTLTVQLVALGQDIGLHLDCSDWSIPLWERRLRKRLAWALYMQDKWSALQHGRPSHINASDWAVPSPIPSDFDESVTADDEDENDEIPELTPQESKGRTLFMQMISLTSIMSEVCSTFYSQTAKAEYARAGRYATQLVLNRAKPVQIKLKDWFAKLPAECKMDSSTANPSEADDEFSSTGYLHLAYFATEICIHRRIVQSLAPTTTTTETGTSSDPAPDPYMLYIIRSAAKTRLISAMDFINRLKPSHLHAFWFFPSASNFALIGTFGALLMATSPGREEAAFYAARLREFRWTLEVSCQKAEWIGGAVEVLEGNLGLLAGFVEGRERVGWGDEGGEGMEVDE